MKVPSAFGGRRYLFGYSAASGGASFVCSAGAAAASDLACLSAFGARGLRWRGGRFGFGVVSGVSTKPLPSVGLSKSIISPVGAACGLGSNVSGCGAF